MEGPYHLILLPMKKCVVTASYFGRRLERALAKTPESRPRLTVIMEKTDQVGLLVGTVEEKTQIEQLFGLHKEQNSLVGHFKDRVKEMGECAMAPVIFVKGNFPHTTPFGDTMATLWNWIEDNCTGKVWTATDGLMFEKVEDATLFQLSHKTKGKKAAAGVKATAAVKAAQSTGRSVRKPRKPLPFGYGWDDLANW